MITLTFFLTCALGPFILVFILFKVFVHFFEKLIVYLIETVFSLPERIIDSILGKNKVTEKIKETVKEKAKEKATEK